MSAPSRSRSLLIAAGLMLAGAPALSQATHSGRVIAPGDWIRVRQIEGEEHEQAGLERMCEHDAVRRRHVSMRAGEP